MNILRASFALIAGLFVPGVSTLSARIVEGRLAAGDGTLASGEYRDHHSMNGRSGDRVVIELRSTDFDPYLLITSPSGETFSNDDFEGSQERSRLDLTLTENGAYQVTVTSYAKDETGAYRLELPDTNPAGGLRTERGRLESGDRQLRSGEFVDDYTFEGRAGERVVLDLRSTDFDPYLILRPPTGEQQSNDDFDSSTSHSRIEFTLTENGTHRVQVTSFEEDETGSYVLQLPAASRDGGAAASVVRERGRLQQGDLKLTSGEFKDDFTFEGIAGERVVIDLRSDDFDPYLILKIPGGEQEDNDDHDGSASWSQIAFTLTRTGTHTVSATTYRAGDTGEYEYVLTRRSGAADPRRRTEQGRLSEGDVVLKNGEFADKFPLQAAPGSRIVLDLTSDDFDTYLVLRSPSGESVDNDDHDGSTARSRIEHTATEAGEYTVYVTSYEKGDTGDYRLDVLMDEQAGTPDREIVNIGLGESRRGRLEAGDLLREDRGFADTYLFEAEPGQAVVIDLRGTDLDTYLVVTTPGGREIENDDFGEDLAHSRIEIPIEEAGRYRVHVTSYDADDTGDYELSLQRQSRAEAATVADFGSGRIFGIFVGISEYGGRASDLSYTDQDAVRVRDAMVQAAGMAPGNAYLLQNSAATRTAFESALRQITSRVTPRDTLLIFFSGHGGRVPRPTGFDRADPDGLDETLEFYDREMRDDELAALLDSVSAGRQLLVFDSCFSGGFAKDVISAPGRMGLFSSEEDVTSSVAAKFRAGGYLSVFFADSLVERYADEDSDGGLSALELSHYIAECYRAQVKGPSEDYVSTSMNLGYQKLVVDRGSIAPYDIVFRRR